MLSPPGLASLAQQLRRDLALLGLPPPNWPATITAPGGAPVLDVVVIGGGMYGIAAAAALTLKGIRNVLILDKAAEGQEGPWLSYARMETLRSPKHLPGLSLGIPSLTFRAWYEAAFGEAAWGALTKIPNAAWQAYLTWLRRTLMLELRSGTEVTAIQPHQGLLALTTSGTGPPLLARRVVLATGRPGTGGGVVPPGIDRDLWPDLAAHTEQAIDFERLRGRRVAVIGAGPSAWDNAATSLEHGAERVDMLVRRTALPQINKGRGSAHPGFFEGWPELPPAERWRLIVTMHDLQAPPPHETVLRTLRHPGFYIHFGTHLRHARRRNGQVALSLVPEQEWMADFLITGTGFATDLAQSRELSAFEPWIARWSDCYTPPPELNRPLLAQCPWLGAGFELTPRNAGAPAELPRIHLFCHAAFASMGAIASDIPGLSTGAERLAHAIAAHFFTEDIAVMRDRLDAFAEPELEATPFFDPTQFPSSSFAGGRGQG